MLKDKRWVILNSSDDDARIGIKDLNLSPAIIKILKNRGIDDESKILNFIYPELDMLYDPYLLPDMKDTVEIVKNAVENNKRIMVYGDYDADGITSTSVLMNCLMSVGADVHYYIPDRIDEGYGLNMDAIDEIVKDGTKLIITVDCGVSSIDEVRYCKEKGCSIIITDHHECGEVLPDTLVVNPKRGDSVYPFKGLAGVGVAFKLVQALSAVFDGINPYDYLDLVAIGTIADVVPLTDENRIIVKYGLESIKHTNNIGINALIEAVNIQSDEITSGQVGYILAPRINAAGRVDNAAYGVELFTTGDVDEAKEYASVLCEANKKRQEIEEKILIEADEKLEGADDRTIVLYSESWHIGVIGIVASKLMEKYNKPVILLNQSGNILRGSARSIDGFNMFEALSKCSDLLDKFGGHEQAAGLTLNSDRVDEFKARFNLIAENEIDEECMKQVINAECELKESDITLGFIDELRLLEPYGTGNPFPLFVYKGGIIDDMRAVGAQGRHLKMKIIMDGTLNDAIAFNMGEDIKEYSQFNYIDIVFSIEKNVWNGRESVSLNVKDIRESIFKKIEKEYYRNLKTYIYSLFDDLSERDIPPLGFDMAGKDAKGMLEEALNKPGSMVFVSSSIGLEKILEQIDGFDLYMECNEKRMNRNAYDSNCTNNDTDMSNKAARTSVIVCPDLQKICYDGINDIYILDNIINYGKLAEVCEREGMSCHLYFHDAAADMKFIDSIRPTRDRVEKTYIYLKNISNCNQCITSMDKISYDLGMNILAAYFSVKALAELTILDAEPVKGGSVLLRINPGNRNSMDNSYTVKKFDLLYKKQEFINTLYKDMRGNNNGHKRKNQGN